MTGATQIIKSSFSFPGSWSRAYYRMKFLRKNRFAARAGFSCELKRYWGLGLLWYFLYLPLAPKKKDPRRWFLFPWVPVANICYRRGLKHHQSMPLGAEGWVQTLLHFYKACRTKVCFLWKQVNKILCEVPTENKKYELKSPRAFPGYAYMKGDNSL